ncbi:murein L,D-transpeptidase [Stappia sp. MMSF_3263]|uniref:L,D-transpeptidase family protein n=1 Tax=Stappia sp. MMSF_3263 TaxID=3046693 RepID=UPI00273D0D80|nr:L,D-transpeptidase family protein [Stappia sp. MMSF_3263]
MARSIFSRPLDHSLVLGRMLALAAMTGLAASPAVATTQEAEAAVPGAAVVAPLPVGALESLLSSGEAFTEADRAAPYLTGARRQALAAFYKGRGQEPLWTRDHVPTLAARRLIARLGQAGRDGLKEDDYALPDDLARTAGRLEETRAARFEVLLSAALLAYADHAQAGRLEPDSLSKNITLAPERPDPAAVMAALAAAADPVARLDLYNPQHPGFRALRDKLAELTRPDLVSEAPPTVPEGATLKQGMRDPRVVILRKRLGLETAADAGAAVATEAASETAPAEAAETEPETATDAVADVAGENADAQVAGAQVADAQVAGADVATDAVADATDEDLFDADVKAAVLAFQSDNGLHPDGVVGPRTLLALNAVSDDGMAVSDIVANLERWRWMPRELGAFHIFVNIPEFKARLFRDGAQVYETRVVVGKSSNQTPVFSDVMDHVIVNPYWNVPYSIASEELLPSIAADPSYLARKNYEVVAGGRVINAGAVDWASVNLRSVRIRQRPGGGNALGQIKFMFPNRHSVYLHDTPSKSLFARPSRAFSHGCVRVQDPFDFADALLQLDPNWNAAKLKAMVGGSEKRVDLTKSVPVHLAYFTAFVDEAGKLQRRPDIYGHNAVLTKALEIEGWQDWQRFAVAAPVKRARAEIRPFEPVRERSPADIRAERQRMFQLRQRAASDY